MSESERRFSELKKLLVGRMITNIYLDDLQDGLTVLLGRRHSWDQGEWVELSESDEGRVHVQISAQQPGSLVIGHLGIADGPEAESWVVIDPKMPEKIVRAWD